MKLISISTSCRLLIGMLALASVLPVSSRAQVLYSQDFDSLGLGAGALGSSFIISPYGDANPTGDLTTDPIQGTVSYNGGKAGYLAGAGTNLSLAAGTGHYLGIEIFPNTAYTTVNHIGTGQAIQSFDVDFLVQRNASTNGQGFAFNLYDAADASDANTYAFHSYVNIDTDNRLYLQDYYYYNNGDTGASPWVDSGFTLTSNREYHLNITIDYNTALWTAYLVDSTNSVQTFLTAPGGRSTNDANFTLSGWSDSTGSGDITLAANSVGAADHALTDRLVFDNVVFSAVPEPSTWALLGTGLGCLGLTTIRRWRRSHS